MKNYKLAKGIIDKSDYIIEEDNETEKMKQIQSVPKDVNLNKLFVMVVFCFMC